MVRGNGKGLAGALQWWAEPCCLSENFSFVSIPLLPLSLSLPPSLPVGFSCWQEGLWSLTGSAQALMLSLPIHSESSRPSSSCKWADTGAGRCTEWWGQGHSSVPMPSATLSLLQGDGVLQPIMRLPQSMTHSIRRSLLSIVIWQYFVQD